MQNATGWTAKYFNDEAKAKVKERKKLWSPDFEERVTREGNELFHGIDRALKEDPAGAVAQALVKRWQKLVGKFTGRKCRNPEGTERDACGHFQLGARRTPAPRSSPRFRPSSSKR